jgi:SAM-dependent methyltransferase
MKAESFEFSSSYYDLIYSEKNYEKEADFIEQIFRFAAQKPKKMLEIGCGTGNYTKVLLEKGYRITGLDLSENMLAVARKKCACNFIKSDMRDFLLNDKFDACIAMFAVIGYVTENSDIVKALKNIRAHLKPNGLFVFDVWNGLAVMRTLPELRVKTMENDQVKIIRIANPTLRSFDHICEVNYKLIVLNKDNNTFNEFDEQHVVRFYFPQEIKHLLMDAGFEILKICPFLDLDRTVDETVWNIAVIAKAVEAKV